VICFDISPPAMMRSCGLLWF